MRDFLRAGLVLVCLILVLVQGVPAFSVSQITIDPGGSLFPGTPVVITGTIYFRLSSNESFPGPGDIFFSTDLEKTKWTHTYFFDGDEIPQPAAFEHTGEYPAGIIYDPDFKSDSEKFILTGITPNVTHTANITLFRVCEYDNHYNVVPGSCIERTTVVVYIWEVRNKLNSVAANLSGFRSHIDEKAAMGVDTSEAEAKYGKADQHLKSACDRCGGYLQGLKNLESAEVAISEGERFLDKAWADKEVADAQVPINNVDAIIGWFKANSSTADDPQLPAIIVKREVSVSYISAANDHLSSGDYEEARVKAQEAYLKANETYTDALSLQGTVTTCCGPGPVRQPFFRACIAVIVLIVIGIIWWKKFPKE